MLDEIFQWFSSFGTSEWLGLAGILATIVVAVIFRSKASKVNQKSNGNESPNINSIGNVTYNRHDK